MHTSEEPKVRTAAIIVSRNRPDLVNELVEHLSAFMDTDDIYVVECGTERNCQYKNTIWYHDEPFKGKCFGHYVGYQYVRALKKYHYFWFLHNDVKFWTDDGSSPLEGLLKVMQATPVGVLSPSEPNGPYPDCKPRGPKDWHMVSTCDYLAPLMDVCMLDKIGPLNPDFTYCWGAIHELAYKAYSANRYVGYANKVFMHHFGGSTYGKKGTISRDEYQREAKKFAASYFVKNYGEDWDDKFSKVLPADIKVNTFKEHRRLWESR